MNTESETEPNHPLPTDNAPHSTEPITVNGWYDLDDGTVGYYVASPERGPKLLYRRGRVPTPAEWDAELAQDWREMHGHPDAQD